MKLQDVPEGSLFVWRDDWMDEYADPESDPLHETDGKGLYVRGPHQWQTGRATTISCFRLFPPPGYQSPDLCSSDLRVTRIEELCKSCLDVLAVTKKHRACPCWTGEEA